MILPAQTIRAENIITPFFERTMFEGVTFGLSPAGYDVRLAKNLVLYPGDFVLASTLEHFNMPNDVLGVVHDKSTWARVGLALQNTVIEPGWRGYLTLEISHHKFEHEKIVLFSGTPIAQIIFHRLEEETVQPYQGKYQDQPAGSQAAIFDYGSC